MLVSVIMPMRNAGAYVAKALRSILAETIPLELIVVDDGSTDHSRAIVQSFNDPRIRLIDGPCLGIYAALNAAIEAATGEIVMRCDADDTYPPGRIARQAQWLIASPEYGAICGGFSATRGIFEAPFATGEEAGEITDELRSGVTRTHFCTFAVRREHLPMARDFFKTGGDIDLQLRIGELCRVWYDPIVCYRWRLHGSSITHSSGAALTAFYDQSARAFQRERMSTGTDALQRGSPPPITLTGDSPLPLLIHDALAAVAWHELGRGKRGAALGYALKAAAAKPSLSTIRTLAVIAAKAAQQRVTEAKASARAA